MGYNVCNEDYSSQMNMKYEDLYVYKKIILEMIMLNNTAKNVVCYQFETTILSLLFFWIVIYI